MGVFAILAMDDKGGIGKDSTLPWPHNSDDLKWFKEKTFGKTVIMGSKTWNDPKMPKPLKDRTTVVLTTRPNDIESGCDFVLSGEPLDVIAELALGGHSDLVIIGGANIINQYIDYCDEIYITNIPGDYNCDTYIDLDKLTHFSNQEQFSYKSISVTRYFHEK